MTKAKTRTDLRAHTFREVAPKCAKPVVIPAHVKVTVCPSGTDARFAAAPGHVGEFAREWADRRTAS